MIELLAPAGDLEKLKAAVLYGADAVYIAGGKYGLRAKAKNFDDADMIEGIEFAHNHNCKVYVTVNIFAHNDDLDGFCDYIKQLEKVSVDAVIVSDPGLMTIIKDTSPRMEIHISTQANVTNYASALFWYNQGAKRVVLARELSLLEIKRITERTAGKLDVECFVHGAMCLSYSGRCYLSQFMSGRDANRGNCSQPCRWGYALVEEQREGEFFPVYEDDKGAYILNSKDLRMVDHIPELIEAGVTSLKIEGRMKTAYYVASTVKAYRTAIDDYFDNAETYFNSLKKYREETEKTSHRRYYTGFYFGSETGQHCESSSYIRGYEFLGVVLDYDEESKIAKIAQRNKFSVGCDIEVLQREGDGFSFKLTELFDTDRSRITSAPHAGQIVYMPIPKKVKAYDMLRRAQQK